MHWLVVGGGTAGCVVAARLSDVGGNRVTLLEAGTGDGRRIGGTSSLADLAVAGSVWNPLGPYLLGRGLGGSSRVNGAILSGEGVELLPSETVGVAELGPVDRALLAAAPDAEPAVLARRDGTLLSSADVFLAAALDRPNLEVVGAAEVRSIRLDGRRATGADLTDGEVIDADAVVLCAGAVHSPAILMRSGLVAPGLGEVFDHPSRVIDLVLRPGMEAGDDGLVSGAVLRRGGTEVVPLNHVGSSHPGAAALLVGALGHRRRGQVSLASDGAPLLAFAPLGSDDAAALDAAVALAVDLLDTPAFRQLVTTWSVAPDVGGYFHAAGSCRSVVDTAGTGGAAGAVVGYDGLHVADSSIVELPASGLYGPTVAAAARVAAALVASAP